MYFGAENGRICIIAEHGDTAERLIQAGREHGAFSLAPYGGGTRYLVRLGPPETPVGQYTEAELRERLTS